MGREEGRGCSLELATTVVGATLCAALWLVLALVQNASNEHGHVVGWEKVLPVYRLSAMPILCIWFWGLNLLVWERARMNHVAIFDFNPTSALSHTPLFRLAGFLTVIWCTSFVLYVGTAGGYFFYVDLAQMFPLGLTALLSFILFCPFDIFYLSSRIFFLQVLLSVVSAPFGQVRFVEGYVGDLLTSMVKTLGDAEYTVCYYATNEWIEGGGHCKVANRWGTAILGCLPVYWRMMQCIGRYSATRHIEHLGNTAKYAVALTVVLFSQLNGDLSTDEKWSAVKVLWCISFVVSTLYSYVWDIFMDWGLAWNSSNFSNRKWFYYYCITSNLMFRFFWTITLSGSPVQLGIDSTTLSWIAALVEIVRRFTWSLLRVENVHQTKFGDTVRSDANLLPLHLKVNHKPKLSQ